MKFKMGLMMIAPLALGLAACSGSQSDNATSAAGDNGANMSGMSTDTDMSGNAMGSGMADGSNMGGDLNSSGDMGGMSNGSMANGSMSSGSGAMGNGAGTTPPQP